MTVPISPMKIRSLLKLYFAGCPQVVIQQKTGVNQSTVSDYANDFKQAAATQGLMAAAKEYGIMDEVDALRSLSVELYKEDLTAADAREGADIIKHFKKQGVLPADHKFLVAACKSANAPSFSQAVVELGKIMAQTGLSYAQSIKAYKDSLASLSKTNQQLAGATGQLADKQMQLGNLNSQVMAAQTKLAQEVKQAQQQEAQMAGEIASGMKNKKVKEADIDEVVALRTAMAGTGLDVATLIFIAEEFKK